MSQVVKKIEGGASLVVAWRLAGKRVLVVGGGVEGTRRVEAALQADAQVRVVAPRAHESLRVRESLGEVELVRRHFKDEDLEGVDMVLSTIDDHEESLRIATLARSQRIPVNCADIPALCDFWFAAQFRDGPLQVAVSTNGKAPKLGAMIRQQIRSAVPEHSGDALERVNVLRQRIRQADPDPQSCAHRMKWMSALCTNTPIPDLATLTDERIDVLVDDYLHHGDEQKTDTDNHRVEERAVSPSSSDSGVSDTTTDTNTARNDAGTLEEPLLTLVGAGPGSPDMMTMAGVKALRAAHLVVADKLVPSAIIDEYVNREVTEVRVANKTAGNADAYQDAMNRMVLDGLRAGKRVVRLKCGDPFVFGRGGEEVLFFRSHGFAARVLPGVSSAIAAPLAGGIPVTHRGSANQLLITTGRGKNGELPVLPAYEPLRTVVFLMGVAALPTVTRELTEKLAYPRDTPVAVVERAFHGANRAHERTVRGTLETIAQIAKDHAIVAPATVVVGRVVDVLVEAES